MGLVFSTSDNNNKLNNLINVVLHCCSVNRCYFLLIQYLSSVTLLDFYYLLDIIFALWHSLLKSHFHEFTSKLSWLLVWRFLKRIHNVAPERVTKDGCKILFVYWNASHCLQCSDWFKRSTTYLNNPITSADDFWMQSG